MIHLGWGSYFRLNHEFLKRRAQSIKFIEISEFCFSLENEFKLIRFNSDLFPSPGSLSILRHALK